ncbi:AzlC family ABC transporter permease [Streptobacillus felis]|uniref:AzlC family ABC transporter permease n=1 Tax=Streptobacillus felis TaxID=1384509 RepID=A0A7Z0PED7_9FUSO|nr:AzlC family ABC transporter permease [Streptobacillus felis]NYV27686.1 AzlC family ABC transporter permease [Streptobacillus felis]
MDLIKKFNKQEFIEGLKAAKGIAIAFIPFGFALGLIANSYNVNAVISSAMTFIIYSGASQVLLYKIFESSNFDIFSAVFAAAMLNFRYVLINIPMYKALNGYDRKSKSLVGVMFTDETVAFLALKKNKSLSFAFGVNLLGYLSFSLSSVFGVLLGNYVPLIIINSMKFVLYGTFLSLLISSLIMDIKNLKIVLIALGLKLIFMFIYPFNLIPQSLQIVLILTLTSLIYAIISVRRDVK